MTGKSRKEKLFWGFEMVTVTALQILIIASVAIATAILYVLFVNGLRATQIASVSSLLPAMQRVFAGVLIVLLGLELTETLKAYFAEHHIRVEVILIVAIIAVGRHMIQLDLDHTPGTVLLGLSALMLSLTAGYFLIKKAQAPFTAARAVGLPTKEPENIHPSPE